LSPNEPKRIKTKHEGTAFVLEISNEFKLERRPSMDEDLCAVEFEAKSGIDGKTRSSSFAHETSFASNSFDEVDHGYHTV
jgi:hypothetical protein